jgi:hypothetical protein
MENRSDTPDKPRPRQFKEYEDPHFHDDIEVVPPDDERAEGRQPAKRKPTRRPPSRRHYYED